MIKLREILEMPVFEGFKIVAGHAGTDRDVCTVSVMDAPDIYKWMKGGEFLITSGYVVKDQPEYIKTLIINLEKKGAAALGVKFDRFIHEFPDEALETADKLGFPIVSIPFEFAFTDIINPVLREVIDSQSKKLLYAENVHESFTKMVLEDEKIPAILKSLEHYIHCQAAFVDVCFYKVYFAEGSPEDTRFYREAGACFSGTEDVPGLLERYDYYRMYINEEEYGYILIGGHQKGYEESFADYYKIAIEQAGTVLILKIQKQLAAAQIEADYREQFVQDMLTRNIHSREEIMNRAMIYNWSFYAGGIVVIVDIDHFKQQYLDHLDRERNRALENIMKRVLNISKRIAGRRYEHFVYSKLSDQIVFIISEEYGDERTFLAELKESFWEVKGEITKAVSFTATVGIGNYKKDISQIHDSFEEARKAVSISRSMFREDVISVYDELGVFKLLSLVSASEEAKEFQKIYIQKLEEYDGKHHSDMLDTALTLAACGWNLKETSKKLFIHYNSMKYRYQKICSILDVDLNDQEQRLNLELALKLYQINMKL